MNDDDKQREAWQKQHAEDWMIEMNMISPALLGETRLKLLVAFPQLKLVELSYNPKTSQMTFGLKFKKLRALFRRKKLIKRIHFLLADKFKYCEVTVNLI